MTLLRILPILIMMTSGFSPLVCQNKTETALWNTLCISCAEAKILPKNRAPWWPWVVGAASAGAATAWYISRDDLPAAVPCQLNLTALISLSDCGEANGALEIKGEESKNLIFQWSNGREGRPVIELAEGNYFLTATDPSSSCMDTFSWNVGEKIVNLISNSQVVAGNCTDAPQWWISLTAQVTSFYHLELKQANQVFTTQLTGTAVDLVAHIKQESGITLDTGKWNLQILKSGSPIRCGQSLEVTLATIPSAIQALNDSISVQAGETISIDVLNNDTGVKKSITSVGSLPDLSVAWDNFGPITFTIPKEAEAKEIQLPYTISDGCGQKDTAFLVIMIWKAPCQYAVEFSAEGAYCGGKNGSLSAMVLPQDGATLLWSNGSASNVINELAAGTYQLTVTQAGGGCFQVFEGIVPLLEVTYLLDYTIVEMTCNQKPDIHLWLQAPLSGDLSITIQGPGLAQNVVVKEGFHALSKFVEIVPGFWSLIIFDNKAGIDCAQDYLFDIKPFEKPVIKLISTLPPSGETSNDGFIEIQITGSLPLFKAVAGDKVYENLTAGTQVLGGLAAGIYEIIVYDAAECPSNPLLVPLFPNAHVINHRWLPRLILPWQVEAGAVEGSKAPDSVSSVESAAVEFTWKSWMLTAGIGSIQSQPNRKTTPFTQLGLGYRHDIFFVQVYWLFSDRKMHHGGDFADRIWILGIDIIRRPDVSMRFINTLNGFTTKGTGLGIYSAYRW